MYCPYCGERNLTGATLCADCGKGLPQALGPLLPAPLPATSLAPSPLPPRTAPAALTHMPPPAAAPAQPPSILRSPLAPPVLDIVPSRTAPLPMDFLNIPRTDPSSPVSLEDAFDQPTRVTSASSLKAALAEAHTQTSARRHVDTSPDGEMPPPTPTPPVAAAVATPPAVTMAPAIESMRAIERMQAIEPIRDVEPAPRMAAPQPRATPPPPTLAKPTPPKPPAKRAQPATVELSLPRTSSYALSVAIDFGIQAGSALVAILIGVSLVASPLSLQGFVDAIHSRGVMALLPPLLLAWLSLVMVHGVALWMGASVGQRLTRASLRMRSDGGTPPRQRLIMRAAIAATTTLLLGIGPLFGLLWDPLRRNLGDVLSGVVACRAVRSVP